MQPNNKKLCVGTNKSPLALAITAAITGFMAQPAFALGDGVMCAAESTYTVTSSLGDTSDGTLRAAIVLANANADCSQIEFSDNVTNITLDASTTISEDLNIVGSGTDSLTISTATGNAIHATYGDLHISNLKISDSPSAGIYQQYADLTVDNVLLDNNGYGIHADDAYDTVVRNSTITNSQYDSGIKFYNNATGSTLLIDKSDISNNQASGGGGGLYASIGSSADIKISDSTFSGNTSFGAGAGIHISTSGDTSVLIEDSRIMGNGGNGQGGDSGEGGGIYVTNSGTDIEFNINRSTIANNLAGNNGGGISIHNGGSASGNFTISQSTISGNSASGSRGGGIYFDDSSTSPDTLLALLVESSTVIDNVAGYRGGGISHVGANNDDISIQNSVIAQNTANSGYMNLSGVFNSLEYSWVGDNNGDLTFATDPSYTNNPVQSVIEGDESTLNLGDLADNGGTSQTHLPLTNSPLLESGNPNTDGIAATDQRGSNREVNTLDIGAVELNDTPNLDISQTNGMLTLDLGESFDIDISAITTDTDVTIEVSGLPGWLIFDADTANISGVSAELGALEIGITVSNLDESASETLALYVKMNPPSVDTSLISDALNIVTGESVNLDISGITSDDNVTFAVTGLPVGLSFDSATNSITGAAMQGGTYSLVITVSNVDYATEGSVELIASNKSISSSSNGLGSFGYGWLLMLAGVFVRKKG